MIVLTYPPSANRLWRTFKGRMIKSEHYRDWLFENRHAGLGLKTITGPYKMTAQFCAPDKRRRDLGNLEKPVSDLLQSIGVVSDDCNMRHLEVYWSTEFTDGVRVWLEPLGERS